MMTENRQERTLEGREGDEAASGARGEDSTGQRAYWRLIERHYRWNVGVSLAQGWFALFSMGLLLPETVLAAYLTTLTKSKLLIGLPWAFSLAYWSLPSVFYSYYLQRQRQRRRALIVLSVLVRAAFAMMPVSAWVAVVWGARAALIVFLAAEGLLFVTAAGAGLAWHDFMGRVLPPSRRGFFMGLREAVGQFGAFLAAALLFVYLPKGHASPGDYILPFAVGAFAYVISMVLFAFVREPRWPGEVVEKGTWRPYYTSMFSILKGDRNFRTYIFVRCLLAVTCIFNFGLFASYAITDFGISEASVAGLFSATELLGAVAAAAIAGRVGDRLGYKVSLLGGLAMTTLVLAAGLALKWMGAFAFAGFLAIYFLYGGQSSATWVANFNLLLDFGRVEDRPRYISLASLFVAPVALAAAIMSGYLADILGYRTVMFVALVVSVTVWITVYLVFHEPRVHRARPLPAAPAEGA